MDIGKLIRDKRIEYGLTMKEVAQRVGVSEGTISRWESGEINNMKRSSMAALSKELNISPLVLMGWSEAPKTTPTAIYPYFDTAISAGALEAVDAMDSAVRIEVPDAIMGRYAHHKDIVFLKVNGESMNRVIPNGSIIAVQTDIEKESLSNGDIVVAYTAEGYSVKRLFLDRVNHRAILRPDSTDISFSDIVVDCSSYGELHIFGKVVIYSVVL